MTLVLLEGLLLQALIVLLIAFILWLPNASPPQIPTAWATQPVSKAYRRVWDWAQKTWTAPGGHVRVGLWVIAAVFVVVVFLLPGLDAYQPEAVSVAFTLIVINELVRYQNQLEYKRSIIRQMASQSNDFALDAARIAADEGWLPDGSLNGAFLAFAHLEGANLLWAHLDGAILLGARLDGANLLYAHLDGADLRDARLDGAKNLDLASFDRFTTYNERTEWPEEFEVPDVATNVDRLSLKERGQFASEWAKNRVRILREARSR